ncbi:MAG TPA: hypothetical protein VE197_11270, partial [Mycobacterium sp.]|nr:hypothetical protein [Mycobacterium sp.]
MLRHPLLTLVRRSLTRALLLAGLAFLMPALAASAQAAASVSVFPLPGSKFSMPATQITFRGVAPASIGPVQVTGSQSGAHPGRLMADS